MFLVDLDLIQRVNILTILIKAMDDCEEEQSLHICERLHKAVQDAPEYKRGENGELIEVSFAPPPESEGWIPISEI